LITVCTEPQSPQSTLIQKARIESESYDSPDITSLNYEPEESSEDFYVDMGKIVGVCVCVCVCVYWHRLYHAESQEMHA